MTRSYVKGFTLLEVLLAMTIMAIGIVATLELFSGSLRLAGSSASQTEALVLAKSLLDEALWRSDIQEETRSGSEGKYSWVLESRLIERSLLGYDEEPGLGINSEADHLLMEISANVSWGGMGGNRSVRLTTARLVAEY